MEKRKFIKLILGSIMITGGLWVLYAWCVSSNCGTNGISINFLAPALALLGGGIIIIINQIRLHRLDSSIKKT